MKAFFCPFLKKDRFTYNKKGSTIHPERERKRQGKKAREGKDNRDYFNHPKRYVVSNEA